MKETYMPRLQIHLYHNTIAIRTGWFSKVTIPVELDYGFVAYQLRISFKDKLVYACYQCDEKGEHFGKVILECVGSDYENVVKDLKSSIDAFLRKDWKEEGLNKFRQTDNGQT